MGHITFVFPDPAATSVHFTTFNNLFGTSRPILYTTSTRISITVNQFGTLFSLKPRGSSHKPPIDNIKAGKFKITLHLISYIISFLHTFFTLPSDVAKRLVAPFRSFYSCQTMCSSHQCDMHGHLSSSVIFNK